MLISLDERLGPGERVSFVKLAASHFANTTRRYRVAIDASIWLFQCESGKGGNNPALRTHFHRTNRLLALGVEPIFIFDGKQRPKRKRNKNIDPTWSSRLSIDAKSLLKLYGIVCHVAPGEAEAECALLQSAGLVDAVLSNDSDTLAFGCRLRLCDWSPEGSKGKPATHVSVHSSTTIFSRTGIDRDGMILIALMSGGDYDPDGLKGCGPKTAWEAAKGGFGTDLVQLDYTNRAHLTEWQDRLQYELHSNESGWFGKRHPSLNIPRSFPDPAILELYKRPVVSGLN